MRKDSYIEFSREYIEKQISDNNKISKILSWVKENCAVLPYYEKIKLPPERFEEFEKMGTESLDPILICKEPGYALYCDERRVQDFAGEISKCTCFSTQFLILVLLEKEIISYDDWESYYLALVDLNYRPIQIETNILIKIASRSNWTDLQIFKKVSSLLSRPDYDNDWVIITVVLYFDQLWKECPDVESRGLLLFIVMNEYSKRGSSESLMNLYISAVYHLKNYSFSSQIIECLVLWGKLFANNPFRQIVTPFGDDEQQLLK